MSEAVKLGRISVKHDPRTLRLENYVKPKLPDPPTKVDLTCGLHSFGMMLNNQLGCCTIAGAAHMVQIWTANTGTIVTLPDDTAQSYYERWDGYDPRDPTTDRGGYELNVLNSWRKEGLDTFKLIAYVAVNPTDVKTVRQAIALFGGLYIGLALPNSCQGQRVWDVVANDGGLWGGHCVNVCGYDGDLFEVITWGRRQLLTRAFWQRYCDEAYALLSERWLKHFYLGEGLINLPALKNDLLAVASANPSNAVLDRP